ncbi:unnamed protein product, partial [Allacma fusca]
MENRAFQQDDYIPGSVTPNYGKSVEVISLPERRDDAVNLKRTVGLFGSIALIVGTMIGSGIFVSPGGILRNTGQNVWLSLLIWAGCGILSIFGAITYIELSTVIPASGGEYP